MTQKGDYVEIPFSDRFKALLGYHLLMVLVALLLIPTIYGTAGLGPAVGMLLALLAVWGLPVSLLMWMYRRKFIPRPMSPQEREAASRDEFQRWKNQAKIEKFVLSRFVRYPVAIGLGWAAWELKDMAAHFTAQNNLAATACTVVALLVAYDVAIFVIVVSIAVAVIALLAGAASNLTVKGAIIVGAVIVAWAILQANKSRRSDE